MSAKLETKSKRKKLNGALNPDRPMQFTRRDVRQIQRLAKNAGSKALLTKTTRYINKVQQASGQVRRTGNSMKVADEQKIGFRRRIRRPGPRGPTTRGPVNAPSEQIRKEGFKVDNISHPKKVYLNPSDYTVNTTNLPMIEVLRVTPRLNVENFIDALWGVGAMAMAQGIAVGDIYITDSGPVPTLWFFVLCLIYDLWYAMQGQFSYFKKAPIWYWELRTAIMPTKRGKVAYQFSVPQEFFGVNGLLAGGYPLRRDGVSLQSFSSTGSLAGLNTTLPVVTEADLDMNIANICNKIFKDMERLSSACAVVEDNSDTNAYRTSVGVFAAWVVDDPVNDPLFAWSRFYIEVPLSPWEYWLMYLGWASPENVTDIGPVVIRTGQYIQQEFQSGCNLTGRILRGMVGKLPPAHWRIKTVFMEQILWALSAAVVAGDQFYNDKFGVANLDNSTWDRSLMLNITPAYFVTVLGIVMRRVLMTNSAFYDNPQSGMEVWAGIKYYAGPYQTAESLPRFIVETLADLIELCIPTKQMGDIHIVTVFGSGGNFGINPYNNGGSNQYDLTSLATALFPSNPAVSYMMDSTPVFGMFDYVNVDDFTKCNFMGDDVTAALDSVQDIMVGLSGNIMFQPGSSHTNASTLAYYTLVLSPFFDGEEEEPPKVEVKKKGIKEKEKEKIIDVGVGNWTVLYFASVEAMLNAYPFSPDQVSYDMTRLMPVTFVPQNKWIPIFKENYSMPGGFDTTSFIQDWIVTNAKSFAHPIATVGGQEQDQILQENVTQNLDGGFSFLKNLAKPLLDVFLPGIGGLVSGIFDGEEGE